MKTQANEANMVFGWRDAATRDQERTMQKIRNASLKKLYESKIASLTDRGLQPHLLKMMCQDVPWESGDLASKWGRRRFVRKCLRYYQGKIKEIERSEKNWFFRLFS